MTEEESMDTETNDNETNDSIGEHIGQVQWFNKKNKKLLT